MRTRNLILAALAVSACSLASAGDSETTVVDGFVAHGINTYNDQDIGDYSQVAPTVAFLNAQPKIKEIGAITADGTDAAVIDADTDRSLPLATIRSFVDFFNPGAQVDPGLFNLPLDAVGTNFFGWTNPSDRVLMADFENAGPGAVYRAKGTNKRPTVGDWEQISGRIRIECHADGGATAKVSIRDAMPKALYTLWDVGVVNPGKDGEQGYAVPFGGLPNILITDTDGCASKKIELPYCPTRSCDGDSCSSYISAFYHWDAQAYGGSPSQTFTTPAMPVGVVASNQIVWPLTGTVLAEPATRYRPGPARCRS